MEKITKKRFREIIESSTTALIGNINVNKMCLAEVDAFCTAERVNAIEAPLWRTATHKGANYTRFSNGSRLDYQSGQEYYQRDNLLFVFIPDWQTMVYLVA